MTCDLANTIPDTAGTMTVAVSGNYYNGSFGAKNNTLQVYYRYKQPAGSFGSWQTMHVTLNGNGYAAQAQVTGLDYRSAYVFEAYAEDALTTVYAAAKTVKAIPVFDWGQSDFAFHVPVYDQTGAQLGNSDAQWQNPSYLLGEEYCTAERYLGKPVYAKLVDFGVLPNNSNKNVVYCGTGSTGVVSCNAMLSDGNVLYAGVGKDRFVSNVSTITLDCTLYNVRMITDGDFSSVSAYVLVKYTMD